MRVTVKHLQGQISVVNTMLGHGEYPAYNTRGAVALYQAYGGYGVHRYTGESGAVSDLMGGCQTARECQRFLQGMIEALRISHVAPF